MYKNSSSLQWKFLLSIALIIFPILGITFLWVGYQNEQQAMSQVVNQARVLVRQIILTRQWVSDCGGVMVARNSEDGGEAASFYDDRMEPPRGIYQRFTPSMVTKKLSQYSLRQDLYHFRLASSNPMNPENTPDDFERAALVQFASQNVTEAYRTTVEQSETYFQYMVPLVVDKACLQCHKGQGLSKGAIGGGLSVFFPIGSMKASLNSDHVKLGAAGVGIIALTIFTLFFLLRRLVIRPLNDLKQMTGKISDGNLDARVDISTGDELEQLGDAFNSMAVRLSRGRDLLEDKIKQATHELAEANKQVLVNLIENAVKFSDPGTEIKIEVKEEGGNVLVAVKDQGIGISEENLEAVFEKFHTLPSSGDRNKAGGTGLGLIICKGIVQSHGGRIWAESAEGEGSAFFFSIPKEQ